MQKKIAHISVHQSSKVIAILYFLITLVVTIPASVVLYFVYQDPIFFLYVAYPFVFAFVTYISTAILLWLYNIVANSFGGVEIEFEE